MGVEKMLSTMVVLVVLVVEETLLASSSGKEPGMLRMLIVAWSLPGVRLEL